MGEELRNGCEDDIASQLARTHRFHGTGDAPQARVEEFPRMLKVVEDRSATRFSVLARSSGRGS